jgi:hypothetical protein
MSLLTYNGISNDHFFSMTCLVLNYSSIYKKNVVRPWSKRDEINNQPTTKMTEIKVELAIALFAAISQKFETLVG